MSVMTNVALKETCIDYLDAYNNKWDHDAVISDTCKIVDLDLVNMKKSDVNFSASYHLNIK